MGCNPQSLGNLAQTCEKIDWTRIRRFMLTSRLDNTGALNYFTIVASKLIANWQSKFDKYAFETDVLTKIVPSPSIRNFVQAKENENIFTEDNYRKTMNKGDQVVTCEVFEEFPDMIARLQSYEDKDLAAYFVDLDGRVYGYTDGTNLYPLSLEGWNVDDFMFTGDTISRETITFKFKNNSELNKVASIDVLDASGNAVNMAESSEVYNLLDATLTIASPAVTGCTFLPKTKTLIDADAEYISDIPHTAIKLVSQTDGTEITLAGAGSLTENTATGVYTINEAALLTSGVTYDLQISFSGFDIGVTTTERLVVVP